MKSLLLVLWAPEQKSLWRTLQIHVAPGGARDLQVVPDLVRHSEGHRLAGQRIAIPVR